MKKLYRSALIALTLVVSLAVNAQYWRDPAVTNRTYTNPTFIGTISGVESRIGDWGIPFISAPSGTMANNGAVTLGTALDRIYANAYLCLPANAISAGSSAGCYFAQMSSTTVGTVYNNAYTTGIPAIPASPTAFATTGPGAYTGVTTEQGVTIPVTANLIGTSGRLIVSGVANNNNSAGSKTYLIRLGGSAGTAFLNSAQTTITGQYISAEIWNTGVTGAQVGYGKIDTSGGAFAMNIPVTSAIDTTQATSVWFGILKGTATDYTILQSGHVSLSR